MPQTDEIVRITLTPKQRELIRRATGREAEALELSVEDLEERIAPRRLAPRET
jgi:DNA-binding MarR family transcriptional regulator